MRLGELGGLTTCDKEESCSWNGFEVFGILGIELDSSSQFSAISKGR
jgi:hypothetical protein